MSPLEYAAWVTQFEAEPEALSESEKADFLKTLTGVSLASDAFFPFRDSLDVGARYGVSYIVQPGGSNKVRGSAINANVVAAKCHIFSLKVTSSAQHFTLPAPHPTRLSPSSPQDDEVIKAADEYGMTMGFNGIRLFHH